MSVFSITALDRLIEADRRSEARPQQPKKEKESGGAAFRQRRPLYAAYPFASSSSSSSPAAAAAAAAVAEQQQRLQPRSPSPTSFSPSPYVVNHKRRDAKPGPGRSPQSSLTLQLRRAKQGGDGGGGEGEPRDANSGGAGEEKGKGAAAAAAAAAEGREMRDDDPRGKKKLEESSAAARQGNASGAENPAGASRSYARTASGSSSEEWFDAPDGLPSDYSSDEDSRKSPLKDPGPSSRGDPDANVFLQLKAEIQRRVAAEEAREALQQQRDGMARLLSSAGVSLPLPDLGEGARFLDGDDADDGGDKVAVGVGSASVSQRLLVARCVAGAVAAGAVRAEAEAELHAVLAEKSREIARLKDKLQYYELVTHEMSQRNQESIENARQSRRRRQRVQRLVVFGLSVAVCVGVSAAAVHHFSPWETHVKAPTNVAPALPEGDRSNPTSLEQVLSRCKSLLSVKPNTQLTMKHFPQ